MKVENDSKETDVSVVAKKKKKKKKKKRKQTGKFPRTFEPQI